MSAFDKTRVAEVVVRSGRTVQYGSGYRISSKLVLTVGHLLDGSESPACTVLLGGGDTELAATPVWRGAGQDLALLSLDLTAQADAAAEGEAAAIPDRVAPVAFGELPDDVGSVPFTGIGFPAFAQRPDSARFRGLRRRDSRLVKGFVQLGSNMKSRLLDLTFTTAAPAAQGPDGQDPWQGVSGTALFAHDTGLLVGVQAHRLPAAGTGGAEAEPVAPALKDPQLRRELLRAGVRPHAEPVALPGQEPGGRLRSVLSQRELIDGFGDFKKNLTSDQLPYVSPGDNHPADADNLFERLVESSERGMLLVGAAGTGKTRTGIEVGRRALEAGWRVLHVVPGESKAITEEVAEQVLGEPGAVLVVIDYLNHSLNESQLDLAAIRHRLIPEARRRGITVALLASVRPGWLQKANRAQLHELFEKVELRQDPSFQRQVTENALLNLAPTAVRRLTVDHMMAICGHRPVIALLVASEIERRVELGISLPEATGLRSGGELSAWLESRLSEDGLTVAGRADDFTPARASSGLLAAAAAAAACPQDLPEVTATARAALAHTDGPTPRAEDVVATLISLGWLEQDDDGVYSVAHDVVADQLMEFVMLPENDTDPDESRTREMLAGCLISPRTVGRFALNIGRLVNDLTLAGRADVVLPMLERWFADEADTIGQVMRRHPSTGSYALGAICSGAPWSVPAVQCWQQVVDPWLSDFGTGTDARHLLYRGLRRLPHDGVLLLIPTALAWLKSYERRREAGYVLGPLLLRTGLPPVAIRQAVTSTFTWLTRHAGVPEAHFVLGPLLGRADLDPQDGLRAVSATLGWLEHHPTSPEARFVLRPLLSRGDLGPEEGVRAVLAALTWLEAHAGAPDARFVASPLLARGDLGPEEGVRAVLAALTWLEAHAGAPDARFVASPMLARGDLGPEESARAVRAGMTWLGRHAGNADAGFVLRPLLSRGDLDAGESGRAVSAALTWLDQYAEAEEAQFVVRPLLSRGDLGPEESARAVRAGMTWLGRHAGNADAGFVLRPLLSRGDLDAGESGRAVSAALTWLDQYAETEEAQFVVRPLLARGDLGPEESARAVSAALSWLDRHTEAPEAQFVVNPLLSRSDLGSEEAARAVSASLTWLGQHAGNPSAGYVLAPLLSGRRLDLQHPALVFRAALSWLDAYTVTADAGFVLRALLSRADLDSGESGRAVSAALTWLGRHAGNQDAGFVLRPLLSRGDLGAEESARAVSATLTWLDRYAERVEAQFVVGPLLARGDLEPGQSGRAVSAALVWLGRYPGNQDAGFVLRPLLSRGDLGAEESARAVSATLTWLDRYADGVEAQFVVGPLLSRGDLAPEDSARVTSMVLSWLARHPVAPEAQFVLRPLLQRKILAPDDWRLVVATALTWVDHHPQEAELVLRPLLQRVDLDP
ncbi:hypothetical protein ACWCO7_19755, partial [Streptomyces violaceorubidus]